MDSHSLYFAKLPQAVIDNYQNRARITRVPSAKFLKLSQLLESLSSIEDEELAEKFRGIVREKYGRYQDSTLPSLPDVPLILANFQYTDDPCILSILGLKGFYDPRIGYVPGVVMFDFYGDSAFHLLFADGTVKWFHQDLVKTYPGKYQKIANEELALTLEGEVASLCPLTGTPSPFHLPLPQVKDFSFFVRKTAMGYYYDLNYITLTGEAYYSDMETSVKLMEKARKILCYSSTTFVLTDTDELHLYRKGVSCNSFLVQEVIDIYHRYVTREKIEIVAITEHEHIIHCFDGGEEFEISTCPRLSQELESGNMRYVIEY